MKRVLVASVLTSAIVLGLRVNAVRAAASPAAPPGALVLVGGGGTPAEVVARALELAGGPDAKVLVLPQASSREDAGLGSVEMFQEAGARDARRLLLADRDAARRALASADLIWFPGGSQSRLMGALAEAELAELVVARQRAGAVVGGTSAGAAVQTARMITGSPEDEGLRRGNTPSGLGLDLWTDAIADQHFHQRRRFGRLLGLVLDESERIGVGVDEGTAAIWHGAEVEVLGRGNVTVIDARSAQTQETKPGDVHAATGLQLHVLRAGMRWTLPARE